MMRHHGSVLFVLPLAVLICGLSAGVSRTGDAPLCGDEDNVMLLQSATVVRAGALAPQQEALSVARVNSTWSSALARVEAAADRTRSRVLRLFQHSAGQQSKTKAPAFSTADVDIIIAALVFLVPILCFVVSQETPNLPRLPQLTAPNFMGPALALSRGGAGGCAGGNPLAAALHQADQAAGLKSGRREILDGAAALRYAQNQAAAQPFMPPAPPPALAAAGWPGPSVENDMFGVYLILEDAVPVCAAVDLFSTVMGSLHVGEAVTVQEVQWAGDSSHLRGRLKFPAGWISLVNVQDGRQWAVKRSPGPVLMNGLLDGSKVGLSLNQDLVVTQLVDPRAVQFGWCVGDHVLQVNGVPVKGETDFMDEIHRAAVAWKTAGQPIKFDVVRAQPIESEQASRTSRKDAGLMRSQKTSNKSSCFEPGCA